MDRKTRSAPAEIVCPKCTRSNPGGYIWCRHCKTNLSAPAKTSAQKRLPTVPILFLSIFGLVIVLLIGLFLLERPPAPKAGTLFSAPPARSPAEIREDLDAWWRQTHGGHDSLSTSFGTPAPDKPATP